MKKIATLIIVWVVLSFCRLFAYDYPWPVDYNIKNKPLEEINEIVQQFIYENPKFQVYDLDWKAYDNNIPNGSESGIKNEYYKLNLEKREVIPLGMALCGGIFLEDVNAVVGFNIVYIPGRKKNYMQLVSYSKTYEIVKEKIVIIRGKHNFFNDVEPTKKEIPIKESFEKNFLSKLDLEWKYEKPFLLDRGLSKLMSLFRKRKDFSDD
ncbi:MAG: hypothetical protein J6X11_12140 [Treponema sp.]|nr:hypothetical protein [Treponema sp.]